MRRLSAIRIRPASQSHQGLDLESLAESLRVAGLGALTRTREFRIPGTEADAQVVNRLHDIVSELLDDQGPIVLDLGFRHEDGREYLYGWVVSAALRQVPEQYWARGCKVIVLTPEIPQANSEMFEFVADAEWRERVSFAALGANAETLDSIAGDALAHFGNVARSYVESKVGPGASAEVAQSLFLRRRGIFSKGKGSRDAYYLFQYDAGVKESDSLVAYLETYLSNRHVNLIIFDSSSASQWFSESVLAACTSMRQRGLEISWLDQHFLDSELKLTESAGDTWQEETERALRLLDGPGAVICFVVPAYERGRTLRNMRSTFGEGSVGTFSLAVLMSERVQMQSVRTSADGVSSGIVTSRPPSDGRTPSERLVVDFFFRVEIIQVPASDWKVTAAELLGETELAQPVSSWDDLHLSTAQGRRSDLGDSFPVTTVSLWSLFEEYGVAVEMPSVVPRRRLQRPTENFPQLHDLNGWDSHWLAEAATARFEQVLGLDRADFVVLLPDDPTGTAPIARAMDQECGVAVLFVPRAFIDGIEDLPSDLYDRISDWAADEIVVFDESTVSGGTLVSIARLVVQITGDPPAAMGTIIDLSSPDRRTASSMSAKLGIAVDGVPTRFAFQRWMPA